MIHCEKCLTVYTNSVGSGTVLCKECQAKGKKDIFDTQPTCGELSCDECNERYKKAVDRIASLEAESDALRKRLEENRELIPYGPDIPLNGLGTPPLETIEDWIRFFLTVRLRFGNTVSIGQFKFSWGGSGLWAMSDDKARISALEAERDRAVELLRTECLCYEFSAACSRCKQKHAFLASIGGEGE